ncbi:phage tail tape measure protein [Stenotrophomonas maltophilia]|uniref:phage tail tape measure protein n=1 Tax=Stenotrophomonas maltophilia TaxID=40324 RepID=UPI0015DFE55F|nr:phage tail tape measure protein [Stenotrophomonas maltophilia]
MAADKLRLQVILSAMDKATAPLRKIQRGSKGLADQLQRQRESLRKLNAAQRDISAFRQQANAAKLTRTAYDQQRAKVSELAARIKATNAPSRALRREFNEAARAAGVMKLKTQQQATQLQQMRGALERAGISTWQLGTHERQLRSQIEQATRAMQQQQAQLSRLASRQQTMAKASRQAQSMRSAGSSLAMGGAVAGGYGYGLARVLGGMVGAGSAFDAEMSSVQALTRLDKQSEQLAALRAQARQLGAATSFTATDAAQGQGFLAMAGFTPEAIRAAMPGLLDMAKAGRTELARTADIGSNILSGFGLDPKEMTRVSDVLVLGFSTANTNLEMLGDTMKYVAPIAKAAGVSLEESVAMAGLLGNVGIQSSQAGTTLRSMMLRLSAPTAKASAALAQLNVETRDSKGNMRGILDITAEVAKSVENMGSADRLSYLKRIFGEEPAAGMAELISRAGSGEIEKYLNVLQGAEGTAAQTAQIMDANLSGSWKQFKSASEDVMIAVHELLDGPLRGVVDRLTQATRAVGKWVKANPGLAAGIAKVAAVLAALLIAAGGAMVTLGAMLGPLAMLRYLFTAVGVNAGSMFGMIGKVLPMLLNTGRMLLPLLGGISAPVLAIGIAVGVVAALVWKYWEPIKAFMIGVWEGVLDVVTPIMDELMTALEPLGPVWDMISDAMSEAWAWIKKLFEPFEATSEQLQGATDAGRGFGQVLGNVLSVNLRIAVKAISWLVKAFTTVLPAIKNAIGGAWTYLQGAWDLIVGLFTLDGDRIRTGMASMWKGINKILMGWPAKMVQAGKNMIDGLIQGISSLAGSVGDTISGIADGAIDRFKRMLGIQSPSRVFAQLGNFTVQGFTGGIDAGRQRAVQSVARLGDRVRQAGAGVVMAAASMPMAPVGSVPLPAGSAGMPAAQAGGNTYEITVHVGAGADGQAIAQAVREELDRRDRERASRLHSRLTD